MRTAPSRNSGVPRSFSFLTMFTLYNVDGIFFDRVSTTNSAPLIAYMLDVSNYAKAKKAGWKVAFNHGDYPLVPDYVNQADFSIVFENTYAAYTGG